MSIGTLVAARSCIWRGFLQKNEEERMNDIIKSQIFAIRDTGETNMFDLPLLTSIALREGYISL